MSALDVFLWLWIGHCLCDYAWQLDFVAINKNPILNGEHNPIWFWCMLAHASIHALPVMWLTGNIRLAWIMIVSHFIIDYIKCKGLITFNQDQLLHLGVILLLTFLYFA